ncbi:MAG: hypothetical protein GTN62_02915 [Gemmatimonadales bacterium]|nr:hypothetical protein [Gemmatimonadales bacterium]NIN10255.1 hypothetical protein [Gemmatimonadales bacterium]NIN49051.1 hypothetical protein [Gemmatimonadales bacterium]NIP06515.1 hypothetical protein [Gemmatimonadales bacterium]NIQ98858.1 hypothetical protein [Gemmatimonadales bacterium]
MTVYTPDLDAIFTCLAATCPRLTTPEQRVGLELYRRLARGAPVYPQRVADSLETTSGDLLTMLDGGGLRNLVCYDRDRRIIGFGGLSVAQTVHRFTVDGRTLYTWCAWDALFIPELLEVTADVRSACPRTGATIRLSVTPERIISAEPSETVVSFLLPSAALGRSTTAESIASFCDHVRFVASPADGRGWAAPRVGMFLLSLDDAFCLGKMYNARRFGAALDDAAGSPDRRAPSAA